MPRSAALAVYSMAFVPLAAASAISLVPPEQIGPRKTQLIQLVIVAIAMALLPLMGKSVVIGGALGFVWGVMGQGFIAPQLVRLVRIDPALSSASLSLNSSFINMGATLGSVAGGFFLEEVGVTSLPWLGVIGIVLSIGIFAISWVMENARPIGTPSIRQLNQ